MLEFDKEVSSVHAERGKLMEMAKLADLQHLVSSPPGTSERPVQPTPHEQSKSAVRKQGTRLTLQQNERNYQMLGLPAGVILPGTGWR